MSRRFERVAIVNRGEPAMRLIHAVRELNAERRSSIRTIALYTEPDRRAMFTREADETHALGAPTFVDPADGLRKNRYLDDVALRRALVETKADAVWVGWGFVAEHAGFAELCGELGVVFIGPTGEVMRRLGDKITSKRMAEEADVPVAPWSGGPVTGVDEARHYAERLGYPLMIKATAGRGGRGIRRVAGEDRLADAFHQARAEARRWFGDDTVLMEQFVEGARHLEVRIIGDDAGTVWGTSVRDCTVQRRNHKVIEESPSPVLTPEQDASLRAAAARLGARVGYRSAGTVEFLYDPKRGRFSFTEVNARLQVEHPVTELCTGIDIVKLQLQVAAGQKLPSAPPAGTGHAIEVRVRAEDVANGFAPAAGRIRRLRLPTGPGVRVDIGVEVGDEIPAHFDPLIAKIIARGRDRDEALARLHRALHDTAIVIEGGVSNKGFLLTLLDRPELRASEVDVDWLDRLIVDGAHLSRAHAEVAVAQAAIEAYEAELALERARFYSTATRGRPEVGDEVGRCIKLTYGRERYEIRVRRLGPDRYRLEVGGHRIGVRVDHPGGGASRLIFPQRTYRIVSLTEGLAHLVEVDGIPHRVRRDGSGWIRAQAPAMVVSIDVAPGDEVEAGDRLVVVEAMKTEMAMVASFPGRVREIGVTANTQIAPGAPLVCIEPRADPDAVDRVGRVDFAALAREATETTGGLREFRSLVLGYDADVAPLMDTLRTHGTFSPGARLDDRAIWKSECDAIEAFISLIALFRARRGRAEHGPSGVLETQPSGRSVTEYFHTYLHDIGAHGAHLPEKFVSKLRDALSQYGIETLERTPALEESLFRIFKSRQEFAAQAGLLMTLLDRRLEHIDALRPLADTDFRALLDRLVTETEGRFSTLSALAREVRHAYFSRPVLEAARDRAYVEAEAHLEALFTGADPAEREAHIVALVRCPQPLEGIMSQRMADMPWADSGVMLETMTRRHYRIRDIKNLELHLDDGLCYATANYDHEQRCHRLITTFSCIDRLAHTAARVAALARAVPQDRSVLIDFYVGQPEPPGDADAAMRELESLFEALDFGRPPHRIVVTLSGSAAKRGPGDVLHFTFRPDATGGPGAVREDTLYRGLHPMMGKRLNLWRFSRFELERLPARGDIYLFRARAHENRNDERLFALAEVRDLTAVRNEDGRVIGLPHLERTLIEALASMRAWQAHSPPRRRLLWNRVYLFVWPPLDIAPDEMHTITHKLANATGALGLERILVQAYVPAPAGGFVERLIDIGKSDQQGLSIRFRALPDQPMEPLSPYTQKVVRLRQRGLVYPYELLAMLASVREGAQTAAPIQTDSPTTSSNFPPGEFIEHDIDEHGRLAPTHRPAGENTCNIITGVIRNFTPRYPEGITRVAILSDPSRGMGNVAEAECLRINAALALARRMQVPVEWFAVSAGARIAMDSGTENMDWIALVLRRIIEFTQAGGELNIVDLGINVGAQPYWNAEATMLMHTRGILIMTEDAAMVLTGKRALDYSGGVSAEDNFGIGGYERIMGPNGQAQYFAQDMSEACHILLRHYEHAYVAPGERFPRRAPTTDPIRRDVRTAHHGRIEGTAFDTVGDIFGPESNPGRKKPFDIRRIMRATTDRDHEPLERWADMRDAETAVVWDAHLGGWPVCLIGLESRPIQRLGYIPADGPARWTAGTLFPQSSKKVARAINAASGSRPLVVLANLSGFDGSPESLRNFQLEYGAEIGRAIVNFDGPITFTVISRYHGGAFVVFSNRLHDNLEIAALEGTYASVIGGAPAAAVVFAREVDKRTLRDPRLVDLIRRLETDRGPDRVRLQTRYDELRPIIRAEMLGQVAEEFDRTHSVHRAQHVGSVHHIIDPGRLRAYLIDAIERGMRRTLDALKLAD